MDTHEALQWYKNTTIENELFDDLQTVEALKEQNDEYLTNKRGLPIDRAHRALVEGTYYDTLVTALTRLNDEMQRQAKDRRRAYLAFVLENQKRDIFDVIHVSDSLFDMTTAVVKFNVGVKLARYYTYLLDNHRTQAEPMREAPCGREGIIVDMHRRMTNRALYWS